MSDTDDALEKNTESEEERGRLGEGLSDQVLYGRDLKKVRR